MGGNDLIIELPLTMLDLQAVEAITQRNNLSYDLVLILKKMILVNPDRAIGKLLKYLYSCFNSIFLRNQTVVSDLVKPGSNQ